MKNFNFLILLFFCFFWLNSYCQKDSSYNRVYEGSLGYFKDELYSYKSTKYNGPLFIDFGIGKQNGIKRRLFHFNYKQTQTMHLDYLHKYKSFGFDYTKTRRLFKFERSGLFCGTSYSAEYCKTNSRPNIDSLNRFMAKNLFGALHFKTEYIHSLNKELYLNIGLRLIIVEAGWEYLESTNSNYEKKVLLDNPNLPPPFYFNRINFYLGIGFNKFRSDDTK